MHAFDKRTDRQTDTDFDSKTVRMHAYSHGKNRLSLTIVSHIQRGMIQFTMNIIYSHRHLQKLLPVLILPSHTR